MKRFIFVMLASAALLVLALATSRSSRAQQKREIKMGCKLSEWWICNYQNGHPGEQKGVHQTPEEREGYDRSWKACRHMMDDNTMSAWSVDGDVHLLPKNLGDAQRWVAACKQCMAKKPGGGWCADGTLGGASNGGNFGGRTYGGGFGGQTYGGRPGGDKSADLSRCFEQTARAKIADGYFVKNDSFWRGTKHAIQDLTFWSNTEKGGRCGEFGARGMVWMKSCVDSLFGVDKAVLDDVQVEEKSGVRGRAENADWSSYLSPDQMFEANHRATRVVMPDGRRFVLDFWEAVSTGTPRMQTEEEWARKWKKSVGEQLIGVDSGVVLLTEDQTRLSAAIRRYGEEKGIEYFRKTYNPKTVGKNNVKGDPETWINSWRLQPW